MASISEAPQLADVERARELEKEAEAEASVEAEAAIEADDEHEGDPKQQQEVETTTSNDFHWYEDESTSSNDFRWYDDDEHAPLADQYLHHQAQGSDDVDLDQQQDLLVEVRSPTFYFYGQTPRGEQRTWGQYVDSFGTIYDGQWQNFQYDGTGSLYDPAERTFFVGRFTNSERNGQGWLQYLDDGTTVSGVFNDTASSSSSTMQGSIRYPTGDFYVGGIKGRLMHGRGFLCYSSGDWLALISNEFEDGSINGGEGVAIEADGMLLHHATFSAGVEENTVEIDETLGLYTFEELGLAYDDVVTLALLSVDMSDPSFLAGSFDHLYDLHFDDDETTPNWREWDLVDWFVVSSALGILAFFLRPAVLLRIMRLLSLIPGIFLRIMSVDVMMAHQKRYKNQN